MLQTSRYPSSSLRHHGSCSIRNARSVGCLSTMLHRMTLKLDTLCRASGADESGCCKKCSSNPFGTEGAVSLFNRTLSILLCNTPAPSPPFSPSLLLSPPSPCLLPSLPHSLFPSKKLRACWPLSKDSSNLCPIH